MGTPPPDGIRCASTADCPTSGACASHPVCWTHETVDGTSWCAEQVLQGTYGTATDACDNGVAPAPYSNCFAGTDSAGTAWPFAGQTVSQRYCQTSRATGSGRRLQTEADGKLPPSPPPPPPARCFTFPATPGADQSSRPIPGYAYLSTDPITQGGGAPADLAYAQCHVLLPTMPPPSPPPPSPSPQPSPPPAAAASPALPSEETATTKPCFARSSTTACRLVDAAATAAAAYRACFDDEHGDEHGDDDAATSTSTAVAAAVAAVAERVPMASLVAGDLVLSSPLATTRVLVNQHRLVSMSNMSTSTSTSTSTAKAAAMVTISHAAARDDARPRQPAPSREHE